jgi:hypothetical protein
MSEGRGGGGSTRGELAAGGRHGGGACASVVHEGGTRMLSYRGRVVFAGPPPAYRGARSADACLRGKCENRRFSQFRVPSRPKSLRSGPAGPFPYQDRHHAKKTFCITGARVCARVTRTPLAMINTYYSQCPQGTRMSDLAGDLSAQGAHTRAVALQPPRAGQQQRAHRRPAAPPRDVAAQPGHGVPRDGLHTLWAHLHSAADCARAWFPNAREIVTRLTAGGGGACWGS